MTNAAVLLQVGPFFFFFFFFLYSSKILQNILHLHPTILSNYYTNYTNTTGTGPQGAKDNDYPVAINIKTRKVGPLLKTKGGKHYRKRPGVSQNE